MPEQGLDTERDARLRPILSPSFKPTLSTQSALPIDELKASASLGASDKGACSVATEKPEDTRSMTIEGARTPDPMRRRHGSGSTSASATYAGPVAERVVLGVLEKIKMKLPVYSGLTLNDLAQDATLHIASQFLCFLIAPSPSQSSPNHASTSSDCDSRETPSGSNARPSPPCPLGGANIAVRGLCELLERVSKLQASPVQILHSQVFLLQWLLRFLAARFPEPVVPELEPEIESSQQPEFPFVPEACDSNPLFPSGSSVRSSPMSTSNLVTSSLHTNAHSPHQFSRDVHSNSFPTSTVSSTNNAKEDTKGDTQSLKSNSDLYATPISITPLDPIVTSYVLSVLLTFIPCRTGDLVGYSNDPSAVAAGARRHPTALRTPSQLYTRLTPIPPVPLHGFEDFASPALHADGAGLLCPGVVWNVDTHTQLHQFHCRPPKTSITKMPFVVGSGADSASGPGAHPRSGTGMCVQPYTALHRRMDTYPATLCFLPPSMLLARYAARCVYFISKSGRDYIVDKMFHGGVEEKEAGEQGGRDASEVVWNRILWRMGRLAGISANSDLSDSGEGISVQYEGGAGEQDRESRSLERERERDKGRGKGTVKLKEKEGASLRGFQRDLGGKFHRRRTVPAWSVSAIQGLGGYELSQSWGGLDRGQERSGHFRPRVGLGCQGEEDVVELRMLGFVAMRKERLCEIVRELTSLLVNMSPPAQGAAAAAVRASIFAWLEDAPEEFIRLAGGKSLVYTGNSPGTIDIVSHGIPEDKEGVPSPQSTKPGQRIDGAERLFDLMFALARDYGSSDPQKDHGRLENNVGSAEGVAVKQITAVCALLWTAVGTLFCVCPERVRDSEDGSNNNLLAQLARFTHAPGPNADIALRVYTDICRAAFFVPPYGWGGEGIKEGVNVESGDDSGSKRVEEQRWEKDAGECPLRTVAGDVVNALASLLERHPPYTAQAIDTDLYTDALVAVYRFSPRRAAPLLSAWLSPRCGEAVKLCVVRAALTLVAEAEGFPWQPTIDVFVERCSRRMNGLLRTLLGDANEGASPLPLSLSPSHPDRGTLRRTLLLTLQGLLRLELEFVLCGPSVTDLAEVNRAGVYVLSPPRDHGVLMMSLSMYAAWICGSRRIHREGFKMLKEGALASAGEPRLYTEAGEYLRGSVLTTLFASAQGIVHMWCNTENLLCIHAVRYILEIIAEKAEHGEDTSWKYSEARFPALAMTEIALITAYKSSHIDISSTAIRCIPLFAKIIDDPESPPPSYMAHNQHPSWRHFIAAATRVRIVTLRQGQAAVQKHLRNELTSTAFPCAAHLSGWRECHWRYSILSPVVSASEGAVEPESGLEIGPVSYKERQAEWANLVLALARSSGVCQDSIDSEFFKVLGTHLPDRMPLHYEPKKLVYEFVAQLVEKLAADTLHVRETAKQALGAELHLNVVPILFEQLNVGVPELLKDVIVNVASTPEPKIVLFVKNCIGALSLLVGRVDNDTTLAVCEVGPLLQPFAHFLNHPLTAASDLRTRAQFCGIVYVFVTRRNIFTFGQDLSIRQILLDNIIYWTTNTPTNTMRLEDQTTPEYIRSLRGCQAAALQTACELAKNLQLEPLEQTTSLDKRNVVSRLFHRYLTSFIKCLDLETTEDGASIKSDSIHMPQSIPTPSVNEGQAHECVIDGIAHLVNANADIGFKQCIAFGFDDDPRLRAVFMEVFSRVLKRGTRFDTRDTLKLGSQEAQLCELVRNSEILIDAIVTVCATSEVDSLIPVLLNIFDTRQTMLALAQRLVTREIKEAASPMELFRDNTLINRLLSAFVNQHGYRYLRTILEPLVEETLRVLEVTTLELDPTKLQPGDDLEANSRRVSELAQIFIDRIIASAPRLPSIVVDICHHISTTVVKFWPESKHTAVGGFLFLRFFCPAIVAPDSVDLELPCQGVHSQSKLRRGLVTIAKILQNLSNNMAFGKEAHMVFLNPLLESNIGPMSKFLEEPFTTPSSEHMVDQWLGLTYDDADMMILHRFIQRHHDDIGAILLSACGSRGSDLRTLGGPNEIWTQLCTILVDLGPAIEPARPTVAPAAANFKFQQYMQQNAHLNRDSVRSIFYACEDRPDIFVLRLQVLNVEIVDLHLLMYHLCYSLWECLSSAINCNFVLDYTSSASTAELPLDWLKYYIEFLPTDMRLKVQAVYALNTNALTQRFLRKLFLVSTEPVLARDFYVVASVSELFEHIGHVESIAKSSTGLLETEAVHVFENVYQRYVHRNRSAVTLEVRESHLRITSLKSQEISPKLSGRTVEIVPLDEVDDVYRIASETDSDLNGFVIARYRHGTAMRFSSRNRNTIIQAIRAAKSRADSSDLPTIHRFSGLSDITVTLLIIGLINTCHEQEWPREAANVLLSAVCSYLKYDNIHTILPAKSASFIMHSSAAHVLFSERMAAFAPHLTLDFIIELRLGFNNALINQKMACLSYLPPWVRNLSRFATPGDGLYEQSGVKLRDAVRSLCDLTLRDLDLYPLIKESIWIELSKMDNMILSCVTDELMRMAVDSGIESRECGLAGDVIMTLSSIHVRSRIIARLRQALRKRTLAVINDINDTAWGEVACLVRLAWAASYNPRDSTQNQLFIPETAHVVTMLAGAGPLAMRLSVHGLVMNLLHVLSTSRNPDDPRAAEFNAIVADASSPSTSQLFGLSLSHSSKTYALAKNLSQHLDVSAVEEISKIVLRMIELGAGTPGFANVVKARWMSLVTATVFQAFPYMQARAFTVLGILMGDHLDNEFFYQILVALKRAIKESPEGNCIAVLSILRCMRKLIPGLADYSSYLCGVFWLAVALLQTGHLPYYIESMHLIRVVLEKLQDQLAFSVNSSISMLLQARSPFGNQLAAFDKLSGFSFKDELSFSLSIGFLLYSASQHQTLRKTASDIIRAILCIVARSGQVGSVARTSTRYVHPSSVGFFLASLPFCTTVASLRGLLEDANIDVPFWESKGLFSGVDHHGYECAVPFSLFCATDARSSYSIISFVFGMIELYVGDISEREILYSLLIDANDMHPSIVSEAQSHYLTFSHVDWIDERIGYAFAGHTTTPILTAMVKVFNSVLIFEDQSKLISGSTSTLSTLSHEEPRTRHYLALQELGMSGLATHLHSYHTGIVDFTSFLHLLEQLLDCILD